MRPFKKTDNRSTNDPNSGKKHLINWRKKNKCKKEKIKKSEKYLKNKFKKKTNELSNSSTKSFSLKRNFKKSGKNVKSILHPGLISGTGSGWWSTMLLTIGNPSNPKTFKKPQSWFRLSKKPCSVMQVFSCLKILKKTYNTLWNVFILKWADFIKKTWRKRVWRDSSSNKLNVKNRNLSWRLSIRYIHWRYSCLNGKEW